MPPAKIYPTPHNPYLRAAEAANFDRIEWQPGQPWPKHEDKKWVYQKQFSFAIPDQTALELIARYAPILEVGAGTGYWASLLDQMGVDIIATDKNTLATNPYKFVAKHHFVHTLSAQSAIKEYPNRTVLMIWPPYHEPMDIEVLRMNPRILILIGEQDGCTGSEKGASYLRQKYRLLRTHYIPHWDGLHDYLAVYKRR